MHFPFSQFPLPGHLWSSSQAIQLQLKNTATKITLNVVFHIGASILESESKPCCNGASCERDMPVPDGYRLRHERRAVSQAHGKNDAKSLSYFLV